MFPMILPALVAVSGAVITAARAASITGVGAAAERCAYGDLVYFGDGCFWHTQYDVYVLERAPPFGRSATNVTARTGYGGGYGSGQDGLVCYDYEGTPGTNYCALHYAESVQIALDPAPEAAAAQFALLVTKYFAESFDFDNGVWTRKDPMDAGPQYRNMIGIPGGVNGSLYAAVVKANIHKMPLLVGGAKGETGDSVDEGVVYVYNSIEFPFYRAEQYHQFHTNDVLGRQLPQEYLVTAAVAAKARGWINATCNEDGTDTNVSNIEPQPAHCPPVRAQ